MSSSEPVSVGRDDPWIVENETGELLDCNPSTGRWWTREAAEAYVEEGKAPWAFPRTAIGLPI